MKNFTDWRWWFFIKFQSSKFKETLSCILQVCRILNYMNIKCWQFSRLCHHLHSLPLIFDRTHSEYALKLSRRRFAWHVDSYSSSRSIHTHLERLLDALERSTFYDSNCRVGWDDFNDSEIMEKDAGLTLQTSGEILTALSARSLSVHHLFSPGLISTRWLSHILWET